MEIIIKDITLETLVSNVVKKKFGVKDNLLKDELEPSDPKKMRIDLDGIKDGSITQDGKGKCRSFDSEKKKSRKELGFGKR